ncbi:MAG: hypothetical protein HC921_06555 [Synechococcaceae cyanobacterium SM2_3_1]|nr:hypothetical protein [Synechococcaceae cyanobacterium SM2_3_1]
MTTSVTLQLPEKLYQRLVATATATQQPLEAVMLRALQVGSPPAWDDVPEEFQADLASLDRLADDNLWPIARGQKSREQMERYDLLLEANQERELTEGERMELATLRIEADRFMLRKAQAAAILRWRGHNIPPS